MACILEADTPPRRAERENGQRTVRKADAARRKAHSTILFSAYALAREPHGEQRRTCARAGMPAPSGSGLLRSGTAPGGPMKVAAAEALQLGHIPRTGEALADRIVTAIAVGEFLPGQRLPAERELAELVGVSRSTVRDALARVVSLDLLEIRRGRGGGAFVRHPWGVASGMSVRKILEPEWKALEQVMDFRHLVEALVARTAAERRTKEDVRAIQSALADYERPEDLGQAQAADVRLHHAVAAATHNEELLALREELFSKVSLGFVVEPFTQQIYDTALPQHLALAEAVVNGDEQTAWDVGREHFTITADELRTTLQRAMSTT